MWLMRRDALSLTPCHGNPFREPRHDFAFFTFSGSGYSISVVIMDLSGGIHFDEHQQQLGPVDV